MKAIQSFRKTSFRAILISVLMSLALPLAPAKGAEYTRTPENRVIYEVFVRNFSPEGNFKGVEQQIPRLKELGIDVIWLMPIYLLGEEGKWGTYSSPYAIRNYKEIDPANGSAADLHSLINTIHQAGMEVWFDWVGNHTSKDNVWVSTHPEYYGYNFYSPNGWNDVYQLDVNCAAMHDAMIDAMQYWVDEFDIDGYRCDFASGPSEEFWSKATSRVLKNGKRIAWLAEDNLKPELVSKGYFDYNYAFEFYYDGLKRFADGGSLSGLRDACRALHSNSAYMGRSRMVYTSNHDIVQDLGGTEDRHLHKYLKPLTVLQFTVYGMPLLYNGQEIQHKSGADVYLLVEDGKATVIPNPGVDTYNLYVENNTGWADFYVYAWSESEPELFGAWPGVKGEATATVDGMTCFVFPFEGNGKAYNLIFNNNDGKQYDVTQITLDKNYYFIANADGFETAVETIEAEDAETPVYFNLQGMKVEKPENGVFIKVTGGKSEKVLF